jgi:alkylated DNA nucleotide flippase Atl1
MPRSDEAQAFFHAVYSAVQEIPPGKVTSYGHIAKLVGTRRSPQYFVFPLISHHTSSFLFSLLITAV